MSGPPKQNYLTWLGKLPASRSNVPVLPTPLITLATGYGGVTGVPTRADTWLPCFALSPYQVWVTPCPHTHGGRAAGEGEGAPCPLTSPSQLPATSYTRPLKAFVFAGCSASNILPTGSHRVSAVLPFRLIRSLTTTVKGLRPHSPAPYSALVFFLALTTIC